MAQPEHKLQMQVKRYLIYCLPATYEWTASAAGVRVTEAVAIKMKAAGVRRGWPDLQFLCPDGVTRYIELKAGSSLRPEQKDFRDRCAPHNIWALCKSVEQVDATLRAWGVPLRNHPFPSEITATTRPRRTAIASASSGSPRGP